MSSSARSCPVAISSGTEELVATVNLHDAQVQDWCFEAGGAFRLRVLAGDQQRGYERLTLLYHGAELVGATVDDLRTWRVTEPNVELVEDELNLSDDARYEHRMLIWPDGEIAVRLRSLAVTRHPAEPTERR